MIIVRTVQQWNEIRQSLNDKKVGFVPTMGNLHQGHLSLCKQAKEQNDVTIVSIFVNPTQFNQQSDLALYPRTPEMDEKLLQECGVDYLLLPESSEMYPDEYQIKINETGISEQLEGEHRPGHFTGMLTIVLKLFNWVQPHHAYFGEKDFQQLLLIQKMIKALLLPITIVPCPIIREADGLAMSSRNARLTAIEREVAPHFYRGLKSEKPCDVITDELQKLGFMVDYVVERWGRRLGAVQLGNVRLIDNLLISKEI